MAVYNPQDGSQYIFLVNQQLTHAGERLINSFNGGKKRYKTRSKTRNKKFRYNKYASVYKKQQSYKFNRRKRQ